MVNEHPLPEEEEADGEAEEEEEEEVGEAASFSHLRLMPPTALDPTVATATMSGWILGGFRMVSGWIWSESSPAALRSRH